MSRYNGSQNGSNGGNNDDFEDDITVKLQKYAAMRLEPDNVTTSSHDQYGTSLIVNFDNTEVIDGIVFQRDDKPGTWKVFSAGKFFNLNPEDGLVYEQYNEDTGYSGEMSAQDILDHPRVAGFSETFGGTDYFYTPVGVVIEEAGDIATNDDVEANTTDEPAISLDDASMMLGNGSWVRTFAKKVLSGGDSVIADNDQYGEDAENPKYDPHDWLTTESPSIRDELEGRSLELWITEETDEFDGNEKTFSVPNLMDVKTGNFVTIDNGLGESNTDAESGKAAASDGGTTTKSQSDSTDTESTETTDSPTTSSDDGGLPENVPEKLNDLIDYMARNGETSADEMRNFAQDEVDDPDEINWKAAADEANSRAE